MEASQLTQGPLDQAPQPAGARRVNPVSAFLAEAGHLAGFAAGALLALGGILRYAAEVLRQAGILIFGSAILVVGMQLVIGGECALFGSYFTRAYGANGYIGLVTSICGVREMVPYMFGYVFAAKVGCGLVAELGSMRISEELDAMESLGIDPMRFVVATRIAATWLCVPFLFFASLAVHTLANYLVVVVQIAEVSQGGWEGAHWFFQSPVDVLYSLTKVMAMATTIVVVGMYYGYRARGGPIGVGAATARSMVLNLVLIHMIGGTLTMLFWGFDPRYPVGG